MSDINNLSESELYEQLGILIAGNDDGHSASFKSLNDVHSLINADTSDAASLNLKKLKDLFKGKGEAFFKSAWVKIKAAICAIDRNNIPVDDADSLQKALVIAILGALGTSSAVASFLAAIIVKKGLDQLCPIVN